MKVLVLGAGIIGASVADALAARGADVTVFEMRSPGRGASQASAGMLAPYAESHGDPRLLELCTRSLDLFDDVIARLIDDTGRPVEYARTGTLEVALDATEADALLAVKRHLDAAGVAAEWMDGPAVRAFEPTLATSAVGGLFTRVHGYVAVDPFLRALVHRAMFAGATFQSPVEAASVEQRGDVVEVDTGDCVHRADAVVIATGSWSRRVRVKHVAAIPVRPVRGQLLTLRWHGDGPPRRIVWGTGCYVVPWADGTLLVGATMEEAGFEECTTVRGIQSLTSAVSALVPLAGGAHLDAVRVGLRPMLPDGLPAIGPIARAPRVTVATGHFRNGVLLTPLTAQLVSRYVLDGVEDDAFALTTPNRFLS